MSKASVSADLPVGIFDSGVGGLTVLRALRSILPGEKLVYLGDTARLPYGTKSPESVKRYATHAADFLVERGIKLLVVACNTASALALQQLRERLAPLPVIGVVEPGAAAAVAVPGAARHLVLATETTTANLAYTRAIQALQPDAVVEELPCSMFVALAEEGWHNNAAAEVIARTYLGAVRERSSGDKPDTAILGCTHFPLIRPVIETALGEGITIVDSATTTAQAVQDKLAILNLQRVGAPGDTHLIATDAPARFSRIGSLFLGEEFAAADIEVADIHPTDLRPV